MFVWLQNEWSQVFWAFFKAGLFIAATFAFDAIHFALHRCLKSRWGWLRLLAGPHQAHHDFCDRQLVYHDDEVVRNLFFHVLPEYATQIAVCSVAFLILDPRRCWSPRAFSPRLWRVWLSCAGGTATTCHCPPFRSFVRACS